jgi:hypothetical protein
MKRTSSSLFAFAALLAACGGSTNDTTPPPSGDAGAAGDAAPIDGGGGANEGGGTTPISVACADQARARCQRLDSCTDNTWVTVHYGDEATCESRLAAQCVSSLGASGQGNSAPNVEACAQSLASVSCADLFDDNPQGPCAAQTGQLANGAACGASGQCQSSYCAIPATATCGTCAAPPKAGDACATTGECGSRGGLTCLSGVCVALGAQGAACDKSTPCGFGLSCVGATKTAQGTCQTAAGTVGAACDPRGQTAARCNGTLDLVCDPASKQCVQESVVAANQPCGALGNGAYARCGASGVCEVSGGGGNDAGAGDGGGSDAGGGDAGTSDGGAGDAGPPPPQAGTCVPAAPDGASCDVANGPPCLPPARCVVSTDGGTAGTCVMPDATTCH